MQVKNMLFSSLESEQYKLLQIQSNGLQILGAWL